MAIRKPNKETVVTEMLAELAKGISFNACQDLMDLTWSLPPSTFKRYWKEANSRYQRVDLEAQREIAHVIVEGIKQQTKSRILDKYERMEILSQIARGEILVPKPMVCDGVIEHPTVEPDWQSRKAAIAELNKMDGEYAPVRKEIASTGELKVSTVVKWGDNEISI